MHRNRQKSGYRNYSYLPSARSASVHNPYLTNQLPNPSNAKAISRCIPTLRSSQCQPQTNIHDLPEPLSVFRDLNYSRSRESNSSSNPSVFSLAHTNERRLTIDSNLETAKVLRERLLIDIRQNMHEIDRELITLGQLPLRSRRTPARLTYIEKKIPISYNNNSILLDKPKKVYAVMPRIPTEPRKSNQIVVYSYRGRYHYAPEIEENIVNENGSDIPKFQFETADELPASTIYEILSVDQFCQVHTSRPENRALIFVPQYAENNRTNPDDTIKDIPENKPAKKYRLKPKFVTAPDDFLANNQLNTQDFQSLIQTSSGLRVSFPRSLPIIVNPEIKMEKTLLTMEVPEKEIEKPPMTAEIPEKEIKKPPTTVAVPEKEIEELPTTVEVSENEIEELPTTVTVPEESANKNIEKPSQEESSPSKEIIVLDSSKKEEQRNRKASYFFSDFEAEGDGEEAVVSFNATNLNVPNETELIRENILDKQSIISSSQPQQQQEQQHIDTDEKIKDKDAIPKRTIIRLSIDSFFLPVPD